jgi:hypothetical protein
MWIDAIGTAFAAIRSPELLLPMSLSKGCESSAAKLAGGSQLSPLQGLVNPESGPRLDIAGFPVRPDSSQINPGSAALLGTGFAAIGRRGLPGASTSENR